MFGKKPEPTRNEKQTGLIYIDNSKDKDYNSQRDNIKYPIETCGPTSMAMAIIQAGYTFPGITSKDPADTITEHLTADTAYRKMYGILRTRDTRWRPFNIHAVLTWGINNLFQKEISQFSTNWSLKTILFNIVQGGGAVLAGDFTLPDGRELGHMVSLAGFSTYQQNIKGIKESYDLELEAVKAFIIDDPYGNWYTGYSDHCGNNIEYTKEDFNQIFRNKDNWNAKWAHVIRPKH